MYIYICMYIYYIYMSARVYERTCICIHVYTYVYIYRHIEIFIYVYLYIYIYICVYIFIYIYMYICMYHIYIYTGRQGAAWHEAGGHAQVLGSGIGGIVGQGRRGIGRDWFKRQGGQRGAGARRFRFGRLLRTSRNQGKRKQDEGVVQETPSR